MENASKALLIAGGVLLAVIIISIFYYMYSQISEFKNLTSEDTDQEALMAFNQGFESYNKKLMYGADVLSVLNKAIDNNAKYDVTTDYDSVYYVDVAIILTSDLVQTVETYTKSSTGYEKTGSNNVETIFSKNTEYSLRNNISIIKSALIDAISGACATGDTVYNSQDTSVSTYKTGCTTYQIKYYPAAEFKRKTFKCSGVEYNSAGRVSKMTFMQYS